MDFPLIVLDWLREHWNMRLKSRDRFPPGEFQMIHPEAGQKEPWKGSFSEITRLEFDFRRKNLAIVQKNGWSLNMEDIEFDVDAYNAQRMVAGGYFDFVELEGDLPPPAPGGARRAWQNAVAGAAKTAISGLSIYREMFADSKPVAKDEAERLAAICAVCPQNKKGGFKEWFVAQTAKALTELVGIMRDKDLTTSRDAELGTCKACYCPLKAKVWPSLDLILKKTTDDERAKLDPKCWIIANP